jgi:hypothetical protein
VPAVLYVPGLPGVNLWLALLSPSTLNILVSLLYAALLFFLGWEIVRLVRARSWGVRMDRQGSSWGAYAARSAWLLLLPLAYLLEMHGWRGLFESHRLPVSALWPVVLVGVLMLGAFSNVRAFFLFCSLAMAGVAIHFFAFFASSGVSFSHWVFLLLRIGIPLLAAASLLVRWRWGRHAAVRKRAATQPPK